MNLNCKRSWSHPVKSTISVLIPGFANPFNGWIHFPDITCFIEKPEVCSNCVHSLLQLVVSVIRALFPRLVGTTHFPVAMCLRFLLDVNENFSVHAAVSRNRPLD